MTDLKFEIEDNTAILTYTENYNDGESYSWERNITLDSDTGEVTSIDTDIWTDTVSKDPLIENVNEDNTTTVIRNIKTVTNPIKEYQERPHKILERMKRGF